jgi:hypothetical protein
MKLLRLAMVGLPLVFALACGGGGMGSSGSGIALSLSHSSATVFPGQAPATVNATLARTGSTGNVALSITGLPSGASATIQSPGSGNSGSLTLSAGTAAAGSYSITVTASDGTVSGNAPLGLIIGAVAVISPTTHGPFSVAMSTSFQPAEWDNAFFTLNPSATTTLGNLLPNHIRLQGISKGVPQGSEGTASMTWDFSILDAITQPVLGVGDHSPEFQIAKAPAFMYQQNNSSGSFADTTFSQFAGYAQNLVRYYNAGGFTTPDGIHHVSPAYPTDNITWWGIYNEPSINNNLNPTQYTDMYNALVPAMRSVDSTLKFVGLELCCSSENWVVTFASNVKAPVDVVAAHYYSSCNQKDTDAMLLATVPGFASSVQTIHSNLSTNPQLMNVPVWVTENNVNADFDKGNGISACNGTPFVPDQRGSSAFFAAWRPYVFSQLGKAGVQALYHWDFDADKQYGEVDYTTDALQLSYWVDWWLGRTFPPTAGSQVLQFSTTDEADWETLPVVNSDSSVVIMVANHAVNDPGTDNNGPGAPRTVLLDISALGTFSTGSLITIDATTPVASGPTGAPVTLAAQMPVTLNGYGVVFLLLRH